MRRQGVVKAGKPRDNRAVGCHQVVQDLRVRHAGVTIAQILDNHRHPIPEIAAAQKLTATIVTGPLMLTAILPAAGQPKPSGPTNQLAGGGNSTVDRDTYIQKVREEMLEWRRKLDGFVDGAKATGEDVTSVAGNGLRTAWTKTLTEEHKLQIATAEGLESAKTSFEKADRELAGAWDKVRPRDE